MTQLPKLWPKNKEIYNTLIRKVHLSKISINNAEIRLTSVSPKFTRSIPSRSQVLCRVMLSNFWVIPQHVFLIHLSLSDHREKYVPKKACL